jgi:hypothetical protein
MALLASLASRAQDRRTLQFSETDTVLLNPVSIEYQVAAASGPYFGRDLSDQPKQRLSRSANAPTAMDTVKTLLRDHHITWRSSQEKGYSIGRTSYIMGDTGIVITVHSETELQALYTLLSPVSGIAAGVGQIEYEPMPDRQSIYKTIYQRALKDATGMAAISGSLLGQLIAVEEPQDPLWSLRQMMTEGVEPTMKFFDAMTGRQNLKIQNKVEVKMLFKFELK